MSGNSTIPMITRFAPSPTGFVHIGSIYTALMCERLAHQSGGEFILRIEDTDKKREVEGAIQLIIQGLDHYGIPYDQGPTSEGEKGPHSPYIQSMRGDSYQRYAQQLLDADHAYYAFDTVEELAALRERQESMGVLRPGYYGDYATWRHRSKEEQIAAKESGLPYVVRLRSTGDHLKRFRIVDLVKGSLDLPENDQDIVLLKSDGIPTYHFAHIVDDHEMAVTHVIRGDEWLASLPTHVEIAQKLGFTVLPHAHIAPICKIDGEGKRKLSKRHDPEANVEYYAGAGYPVAAIREYLLSLMGSDFDAWRKANPSAPDTDYPVQMKLIAKSGSPLLDTAKLDFVSKGVIARMKAEDIYQKTLNWAHSTERALFLEGGKVDDGTPDGHLLGNFSDEAIARNHLEADHLAAALMEQRDYCIAIFNIERSGPKVRKDIAKWSEVWNSISYFFDEHFVLTPEAARDLIATNTKCTAEDAASIAAAFLARYPEVKGDKDAWLSAVKDVALTHGYAVDTKEYKADPTKYRGSLGDVAGVLRILLTSRTQAPDLYETMVVMGDGRVQHRLELLK